MLIWIKLHSVDLRATVSAAEENGEGSKSTQPPKLKDLQHQSALSDDEDLVNLHDDFGDFETAEPKTSNDVFEQV